VEKLRICFLGTGSMGSAVLEGLLASGHSKGLVSATTKSEASAKKFRDMGISAMATETVEEANQLMAGDADLIILGVKPHLISQVLEEIQGEIGKNAVIISMAGGITLETMAKGLPENPNLIRSMPNTPALVGMGVTAVAAASTASQAAIDAAMELFAKVGEAILVEEKMINPLSSISGSGPGWVFYIIEQWEKIAIEQGFSQSDAKILVRNTFWGSLELLKTSGEEPAELRRKVTSPGGTTERIIQTFDSADLKGIFSAGLAAAVHRAEEIAKG
jgi:pyrroline-5-carboxylate reductase